MPECIGPVLTTIVWKIERIEGIKVLALEMLKPWLCPGHALMGRLRFTLETHKELGAVIHRSIHAHAHWRLGGLARWVAGRSGDLLERIQTHGAKQ